MKKIIRIITAVIVAGGIIGCAQHPVIQTESRLDENWGRSFEAARFNQILNPEAGKNLEPVEGLDGPAAENVMKSYVKSFERKQEPQRN